jgi:hypothetical protein
MSSSSSTNNFNTTNMYHDLSLLPPSLRMMGAICNQMNGTYCPDRTSSSRVSVTSYSSTIYSGNVTSSGSYIYRGCEWSPMGQ